MSVNVSSSSESGDGVAYSTVRYGDIDVCWLRELEAGGRSFGQDYLPMVEHLCGHVGRIFELCAGAGCIGFSLLANGLCDSLALIDINPVAVEAARETVRRNGLEDRVAVYESDALSAVPDDEQCDLFIAAPPYFLESDLPFLREPWVTPDTSLRSLDPDLRLHRKFYEEIPRFLKPGGSALVQGCTLANPPDAFPPMIEATEGLQYIHTLWHTENRFPFIYYVWSKPAQPSMLIDQIHPERVRVPLQDQPHEPLLLPEHAVHVLQLCNRTGRSVEAKYEIGGDPISYRPVSLIELPAGGELELPQLVLHPEAHIVFRDEHSGSTLASVRGPRSSEPIPQR